MLDCGLATCRPSAAVILTPSKHILILKAHGLSPHLVFNTLYILWLNCLTCVSLQVLQKLGKAVETKDEQFELCAQSLNKQQVQQWKINCPSVNYPL